MNNRAARYARGLLAAAVALVAVGWALACGLVLSRPDHAFPLAEPPVGGGWKPQVVSRAPVRQRDTTRLPRLPEAGETFGEYSGSGCGHLSGEERLFCLSIVGEQKRRDFEQYQAAKARCQWRIQGAFERETDEPFNFLYMHLRDEQLTKSSGYSHLGFNESQAAIYPDTFEVRFKSCEVADQQGYNWTFDRIGPFYSTGGYDWHRHITPNSGDFQTKLLQAGGPLYIRGFMATAVDSDGEIVSMPPIHIHHTHSASHQCLGAAFLYNGLHMAKVGGIGYSEWEFDTHGDRECKQDEGGEACLLQIQPEGYAQKFDLDNAPQGLCHLGDWNDMRPNGSKRLEFWIESAYMWSHKRHEELAFATFVAGLGFVRGFALHDMIELSESDQGRLKREMPMFYDDYVLPPGKSLMWADFTIDVDMSFKSIYFHTHHLWTREMLFFRARPEQLGLDTQPFILEHPSEPMRYDNLNMTFEGIQRYIRQSMTGHPESAELLCQMNQNRWDDRELPKGLMGGVLHNAYERLAYPKCKYGQYRKGTTFVLLSFHEAMKGAPAPSARTMMHSVVYTKIKLSEASVPASYHMRPNNYWLPLLADNTQLLRKPDLMYKLMRMYGQGGIMV